MHVSHAMLFGLSSYHPGGNGATALNAGKGTAGILYPIASNDGEGPKVKDKDEEGAGMRAA